MAERLIKPKALNTLTSFYKNKAQKAVKTGFVLKQIIWLYYGTRSTSEMKDRNNRKKKTIVDQTWLNGKKKKFSAIRQQ